MEPGALVESALPGQCGASSKLRWPLGLITEGIQFCPNLIFQRWAFLLSWHLPSRVSLAKVFGRGVSVHGFHVLPRIRVRVQDTLYLTCLILCQPSPSLCATPSVGGGRASLFVASPLPLFALDAPSCCHDLYRGFVWLGFLSQLPQGNCLCAWGFLFVLCLLRFDARLRRVFQPTIAMRERTVSLGGLEFVFFFVSRQRFLNHADKYF